MKRKLKWLAIVLAVLLLGFGTALLLWPRDRITVESWQKIQIGMTEDEVEEILGAPGISHKEFFAQHERLEKELGRPPFKIEDIKIEELVVPGPLLLSSNSKVWTGRRGMIQIELDQENHVRWKCFQAGRWINGGILDRLRDWLDW
jgi:hypothetical protein